MTKVLILVIFTSLFAGCTKEISTFINKKKEEVNDRATNSSYDMQPDSIKLVVKVLDTQGPDSEQYSYPRSIKVSGPIGILQRIGAYGAAGFVWIGPNNWTGLGQAGEDGTILVKLYPQNGFPDGKPNIVFHYIPACFGCILSNAAPYFPDAMKKWDENFNTDGNNPVKVPPGLNVTKISNEWICYSINDSVRGAVFYNSGMDADPTFSEAKFNMFAKDSIMTEFLLQTYIRLFRGNFQRETNR